LRALRQLARLSGDGETGEKGRKKGENGKKKENRVITFQSGEEKERKVKSSAVCFRVQREEEKERMVVSSLSSRPAEGKKKGENQQRESRVHDVPRYAKGGEKIIVPGIVFLQEGGGKERIATSHLRLINPSVNTREETEGKKGREERRSGNRCIVLCRRRKGRGKWTIKAGAEPPKHGLVREGKGGGG